MGPDDTPSNLADIRRASADAVVWGVPLVLSALVRRAHPATNRFFLLHADLGALAPGLAATHADLYSASAVLDVASGPVILSLPEAHGAFLTLLVHDGWGRILASFDTRETGRPRRVAIVGPAAAAAAIPDDIEVVLAPGDHVWLVCHVLGAGEGGHEDALRLARGVAITSTGVDPYAADELEPLRLEGSGVSIRRSTSLTPVTFFRRMAALLPRHPPVASRPAMLAALRVLDIAPGALFDPSSLPRTINWRRWTSGLAEGLRRVRRTPIGGRAGRAWLEPLQPSGVERGRRAIDSSSPGPSAASALAAGLALGWRQAGIGGLHRAHRRGRPPAGRRQRLRPDLRRVRCAAGRLLVGLPDRPPRTAASGAVREDQRRPLVRRRHADDGRVGNPHTAQSQRRSGPPVARATRRLRRPARTALAGIDPVLAGRRSEARLN